MKKVILMILVFVNFAFALAVIPKAKLDRQKLLKGSTKSIYLLITFDIPKLKIDKKRSSLNLSLVLDSLGLCLIRGS